MKSRVAAPNVDLPSYARMARSAIHVGAFAIHYERSHSSSLQFIPEVDELNKPKINRAAVYRFRTCRESNLRYYDDFGNELR